jgi:hypothetical protein
MIRPARALAAAVALVASLVVPAHAAVLLWTASLSAGQEFPTPPASTASGFGTVRYDTDTHVLSLFLEWEGLTGPGMQAHIHCCVASPPGNAGIALDLWLMDNPQGASGNYFASYDLDLVDPFRAAFTSANGGTTFSAFEALRAALDADEGRAYFNIHTAQYPGGEIRGNLSVPEPATLGLLALALGCAVAARRRVGAARMAA